MPGEQRPLETSYGYTGDADAEWQTQGNPPLTDEQKSAHVNRSRTAAVIKIQEELGVQDNRRRGSRGR